MKQNLYVPGKILFFILILLTGSFHLRAQYCIPTSTNNGVNYIYNFSTSGGVTNISNMGTGGGSYNDYTSMVVSAVQGAAVNWALNQNFTYSNTSIWVDWNQDTDFTDPGELVFAGYGNATNSWMGWNFTVPMTATPGSTRMRIRTQVYNNTPTTPPSCGNTATGETEDYTFQVIPLCATLTSVVATPDQICGSGASVLQATYTANNTSVTVKWYDALGAQIGTGNPFTTPVLTNTTTIYAAADNGYCDTPRMPVTITVLPLPTATVTETICKGASYTFGDRTLTAEGVYVDTFPGAQCDSIVTLYLQVQYPVTDAIEVVACGGIYNGRRYLENTTLQDTVRSAMGCDSVYLQVNVIADLFDLSLTADPEEPYKGEAIHFTTSADNGGYSIIAWSPASWFPFPAHAHEYRIRATESGVVSVTGVSAHGCIDTANVQIHVKPLDYRVFMPNAFSPNGDGKNELFGPRAYSEGGYFIRKFSVFNRWGQCVYNINKQVNAGWNGAYANGHAAESGNYHYYIEVQFTDDHVTTMKGDVTLIR